MLKLLFSFVTFGLAGAMRAADPAPVAPKPRPNILVILADDLGFVDFGCYGSEIPKPNSTPWPPTACASTTSTTCRAAAPRARLVADGYLRPHQVGTCHMAGNRRS